MEGGTACAWVQRLTLESSTELVQTALAHCRRKGATSISLTTPAVNTPAITFYEHCGFTKKRTFQVPNAAMSSGTLILQELEREL